MEIQYFVHVAGLAALAVLGVQQILKLNFIPLTFANKYPVPTNIILSLVASIFVVSQEATTPASVADWAVLVATVSLVAAAAYNNVISRWQELRAMEGPDTKPSK